MNNTIKQESVDLMAEQLYQQMVQHVDNDDYGNSDAIHSEWVVDGKDPEDGEYEFIFIDYLSQV